MVKLFAVGNLVAPSRTTCDSIALLLTAETDEERDELTKQWRDHKLEELNFVGIVGALLAGCLTSTGSWPTILPNGRSIPWTVTTCWYTGIVFALFSVLTAALQAICLHRLSAHKHGLRNICQAITSQPKNVGDAMEVRPRWTQVLGWQARIVFLMMSVLAMILGMCTKIWCGKGFGPYKPKDSGFPWWDDNAKVSCAAIK